MKTENYIQSLVKYSTLTALTASSTLYAIERPTPALHPEEKGPVPAAQVEQQRVAKKAIPMPEVNAQKLAYLGVFGEPISDTLSAHLNLAEGLGIELEIVVPNSPASEAGLQKRDIILSLAGKDISSQDDLRDSIADKNPGDVVKLNYISKGKAASTNLILGARPAPGASIADAGQVPQQNKQPRVEAGGPALPEEFLNKFPREDREKLTQLFKGHLEGLDLQELQKGRGKLEGFDFNLLPKGLNPEINRGIKIKGGFNSRFKMLDQHGSVTLEASKKGKVIELLDKKGKLQYRGPYNNEADKLKVPKELRDRVKNLNIDIGAGFPKIPKIPKIPIIPKLNGIGENDLLFRLGDIGKLKGIPNMMDLEKELERLLEMPNDLQDANAGNLMQFKFNGKNISSSSSSTRIDPQTGNRYFLKKKDNKTQVEVYDPAGKLLYDGPYNTEIDKASVPEEFSDYFEMMATPKAVRKGNRIELKRNPVPAPKQ